MAGKDPKDTKDEDRTDGMDAATHLHDEGNLAAMADELSHGGSDPHDEGDGHGGDGHGEEEHVKRKKRERRPMPGENIGHLNLTPMMDIMTMLLVFLVVSFATEPTNINVSLDMKPPESSSKTPMDAATKVTISKKEIIVEDRVIATVPGLDTKTQVTIAPLREALLERVDHLKAIEARGGKPFDGRLLVVADASTPYSLVTGVLATAGEAQFAEYKLVLMQKPESAE